METQDQYVYWFRNSAPYINAHRGRTFVIQFGGEIIYGPGFAGLVHDVALLNSLGVRLVLVFGARAQIDSHLEAAGVAPHYAEGLRVTSEAALGAVKEVIGRVRVDIEAQLSMGLVNSPMHGASIRVVSGNAVTARPIGVRNGQDFGYTGEVRRIDTDAIANHLADGNIVLVSPLGYSTTGEVFNMHAEDVATAIAVEVRASKLIFLSETAGLNNPAGQHIGHLTLPEAKKLLSAPRPFIGNAVHACRNGVARTHLIDARMEGALLLELFTRDGVGTMISADQYDTVRRATIEDVGGVLELIEPLERDGSLVRRSREKLEVDIERFLLVERDGAIIGCAAGYLFPGEEAYCELACLAVLDEYRNAGRGDALLEAIEREARARDARFLFVLTTRAAHWFKERGFADARVEELPVARQLLYNYQRNSKVLIKNL